MLAAEWTLFENAGLRMNPGAEVEFADDTFFQQWLSVAVGFGLGERSTRAWARVWATSTTRPSSAPAS
ncbi:MAG: hypothetical protein R6X25_05115 [Candidatus Krumholzibacteriia bacterium]